MDQRGERIFYVLDKRPGYLISFKMAAVRRRSVLFYIFNGGDKNYMVSGICFSIKNLKVSSRFIAVDSGRGTRVVRTFSTSGCRWSVRRLKRPKQEVSKAAAACIIQLHKIEYKSVADLDLELSGRPVFICVCIHLPGILLFLLPLSGGGGGGARTAGSPCPSPRSCHSL